MTLEAGHSVGGSRVRPGVGPKSWSGDPGWQNQDLIRVGGADPGGGPDFNFENDPGAQFGGE